MHPKYWHRQDPKAPLFSDLLWSRPENRAYAGKLLIVGGNAQGFAAPADAYVQANKAGIGVARVMLPDALQKSVGKVFEVGEYAPSTPSGSFGQRALAELLAMGHWADGVLLAGDVGRNSETAILFEKFLSKYSGAVTLTKDAIEYVNSLPRMVTERPNTTLVLSFSQLQRFATVAKLPMAFTSTMGLLQVVDTLHALTLDMPLAIITRYGEQFIVAVNGQVSTTPCTADDRIWRVRTAAHASVWWLQNPSKPFEALTTSLVA